MLISQKFKLQDDNAGCGTAKNALSGCRKELLGPKKLKL